LIPNSSEVAGSSGFNSIKSDKDITDTTRQSSTNSVGESQKPQGMPGKGRTTIFPRIDNLYKKKESLPYDEAQTLVWVNRPHEHTKEALKEWLAYALMGIAVGLTAFIMKIMEEAILEFTLHASESFIIDSEGKRTRWVEPWLVYAGLCALWGFIGGMMTTYYGPAATGSGVAELIGYLNGVNYPGFMQFSTLLTKIIGVTFAVCAKLCIGKEGPLAHIGAVIGVSVIYLPGFEHLRNDDTKRVFAAAGASVGVSAAFGAPIGGCLFCYELSKPNTFWTF
jgi:chloride channel 7